MFAGSARPIVVTGGFLGLGGASISLVEVPRESWCLANGEARHAT